MSFYFYFYKMLCRADENKLKTTYVMSYLYKLFETISQVQMQ